MSMAREQNEAVYWLNLEAEAEERLNQLSIAYLSSSSEHIEWIKEQFHLEFGKAKGYRAEAQKWIDKVVEPLLKGE